METNDNLYKPLEPKEIAVEEYIKRILFYDPAPLYQRLSGLIDPLERYNYVNFEVMFPDNPDNSCACGCGLPIKKAKRRWATNDCQKFAMGIWAIIAGKTAYIGWVLGNYLPDTCCKCGSHEAVECDHVIPVNRNGGASWLSNFQFLCKECHKIKTREDNGWVKLKTTK